MKEEAATLKASLTDIAPKNYTVDRKETTPGLEKFVVTKPGVGQKTKPEFSLTIAEPGKVRIQYAPYDHYDEFYYSGELLLSKKNNLNACLKAIVDAMEGKEKKSTWEDDIDLYGLDKHMVDTEKTPDTIHA